MGDSYYQGSIEVDAVGEGNWERVHRGTAVGPTPG